MNRRNKLMRRNRERVMGNPRNPIIALRSGRMQDPVSQLWFTTFEYYHKKTPRVIHFRLDLERGQSAGWKI